MSTATEVILLVEDNEDDVFFMRRALRTSGVTASLCVATDGQQAIDYLAGSGRFGDRAAHPLPNLVFLDLKLPFKNGFEVLDWIRQQASLHHIPVVMLTSSNEDRDRTRSVALGAACYLIKPPSPAMLSEVLASISPGGAPN